MDVSDPDRFDDPESLEVGRKLFAREATFLRGVAKLDQLPPAGLPEVAFAGRSNVGKSSLINALTGRTSLARTSNTPGRTQEINLFDLGGRLMLVDLPGYGYAAVAKTTKRGWSALAEAYLKGRPSLRRALILIDALDGKLVAVGGRLLGRRLRDLLLRAPEALKEPAKALGRGGVAAKQIPLAALDAQPSALLLDGGTGELAFAANGPVRANLVTIGARNGIVGSKRLRHIAVVRKPHQRRLFCRGLCRFQRRVRRAVDVPLPALV